MSTVQNQPGERTSRGTSHLLVSELPTEALIASGASLFRGGSFSTNWMQVQFDKTEREAHFQLAAQMRGWRAVRRKF